MKIQLFQNNKVESPEKWFIFKQSQSFKVYLYSKQVQKTSAGYLLNVKITQNKSAI